MHKIYNIISFCILYALLISCQESLEERASQEAYNFTRKYCPTPFVNYVRTDSITFNKDTRSYTYYCTFGDILDNKYIIDANRNKIENMLISSVKESTTMKPYLEAGFHYIYICRSEKNSDDILIQVAF